MYVTSVFICLLIWAVSGLTFPVDEPVVTWRYCLGIFTCSHYFPNLKKVWTPINQCKSIYTSKSIFAGTCCWLNHWILAANPWNVISFCWKPSTCPCSQVQVHLRLWEFMSRSWEKITDYCVLIFTSHVKRGQTRKWACPPLPDHPVFK